MLYTVRLYRDVSGWSATLKAPSGPQEITRAQVTVESEAVAHGLLRVAHELARCLNRQEHDAVLSLAIAMPPLFG